MIATILDPTASRAVLVVDSDLVRGLSLRFVLAETRIRRGAGRE